MSNYIAKLHESDFDSLMLDLIAEEIIPETQKSIEMNAVTVFETPVSINIPKAKENELITKLGGRSGGFFSTGSLFKVLISLLIISSMVLMYQKKFPQGNSNAAYALPVIEIDKDHSFALLTEKIETKEPEIQKPIHDEIPIIEENTPAEKPSSKTPDKPAIGYMKKEKSYPKEDIYIYTDDELKNIEVGEFNGKADVENYKIAIGKYEYNPYLTDNFYLSSSELILCYYTGEPFRKGFEEYTYFNVGEKMIPEFNRSAGWYRLRGNPVPYSFRMYIVSDKVRLSEKGYNLVDSISEKAWETAFEPFYMKNTEVSNREYREFLEWVKRQNGFEGVEEILSKEQVQYPDTTIKINGKAATKTKIEFHPQIQAMFTYTFFKRNDEVVKRFNSNSINVFPDIHCWTEDFKHAYNEPMVTHYYDHPAYDLYPVVGVSYWQALAFLDWLTYIKQSQLDKEGIPYTIEYSLPSDIEWEIATAYSYDHKDERVFYETQNVDYGWSTDLMITPDNQQNRALRRTTVHGYSEGRQYIDDDFFHTGLVTGGKHNEHTKINNMYWFGGNVSEWMREDYSENWEPVINKRWDLYSLWGRKSDSLLMQIEKYYDSYNDQNGKLVRGANWYDERYHSLDEPNYVGTWAKAFINPDRQHSSVGFRFVIRVKLKDDQIARKKLKITGVNLPKLDYSPVNREDKTMYSNLNGFNFAPMMSTIWDNNGVPDTISVQSFFAKKTEVTNYEWMLFLNYLIDNNEEETLAKCIPNDPNWAYKMANETNPKLAEWGLSEDFSKLICLPLDFIKNNNLDEIPLTSFAKSPVCNISRQAALIFCDWLSTIYAQPDGTGIDFRLPFEIEWEYLAHGDANFTDPYPWGGPYVRDSKGCFLANYTMWVDSNRVYRMTEVKDLTPVASFKPNEYGIYDASGNVAEMVQEAGMIKGGSWASPAKELEVTADQSWDGKPSDKVGFRVVQTFIGRMNYKK